MLLDAYPDGVKEVDINGQLPLHLSAKISLDALKMILYAFPEGATTRNGRGRIPLQVVAASSCHLNEEHREKVRLLLRPVLRDGTALGVGADSGRTNVLRIASLFGLEGELGEPILHACAREKYRCPPNAILRFVKEFPEQLELVDEGGNYPLHVAAANSNLNGKKVWVRSTVDEGEDGRDNFYSDASDGESDWDEIFESDDEDVEWKDLITVLVNSHPAAAARRNLDGRLPLHLALESGKSWYAGIEAIVSAAKDAVTVRDDIDMLYPFMLAAAVDGSCVTTIFELFRRCPEVKRYVVETPPGA